ncbi:MAG: alpha/beta hydrolase [Frankiaceae bacterium]|nr:alpha/beta hydrolase [Arenimonas sp.]
MPRILRRSLKFLIGFATAAALLVAALTAIYWAPDRPVSELTGRWAPPPSQFIPIEGMQVHVRDEGPRDDPSPILLLHGTSSSLHTWEPWAKVLREKHRVISVDLPGYGLTGPFPDGDYRLAHYTRFIGELLDRLDVRHAVVAGNSFGGQVAIELALATPARVDKLILVDALAYPRDSTSVPIGFRIAQMPGLNFLMQYMLPRRIVEDSVRNVMGDPSKVTPALVDRYFAMTVRAGNRASLPARFTFLPTERSAARIVRISKPTLILWGGRDRLIPPNNADRLHRDIAGSQLLVFPALGHVPQEEDPVGTVAAALRFLGPAE